MGSIRDGLERRRAGGDAGAAGERASAELCDGWRAAVAGGEGAGLGAGAGGAASRERVGGDHGGQFAGAAAFDEGSEGLFGAGDTSGVRGRGGNEEAGESAQRGKIARKANKVP